MAIRAALPLGVGIAITLAVLAAPAGAQAPGTPNLYQRLGAYDGIAAFVDLAFPRVATHPDLAHLFRGHAMDTNIRQRQLIIDRFCHDTGGPCAYTGRSLLTVHTGLRITGEEWETFVGIIGAALRERDVAEADRREFLELFDGYREETVGL